jgi:GT2 family glycosyltransferase
VVVVLRNKAHLSILGLCALLLESAVNYELLVVDNASSDETAAVLSLVECAKIIRNSDNRGLGPAVMQAIPWSSGEFLCLLNNDALVERGTLNASVETLSKWPNTGAVGGKILLADGRLQEAGCIIWRDGRTHQYGRLDDPSLPQYNFRRPVDYCSGAFLVVPRSLFLEIGGLDERYGIGYYEDADYCTRTWHAGRSVVYEPRAVLHHYEGASSANQIAVHELIMRNHLKFASQWKAALRLHEVEKPENIIRARVASVSGMLRCLYIVDSWGLSYVESDLAKLGRAIETFSCTCICIGMDRLPHPHEYCYSDIDVEQHGLDTVSDDDLRGYFAASDRIVVAAEESATVKIKSLLQDYAGKIVQSLRRGSA